MSKLKNAGTMLITAIPIVVWLWGVVSYGVAGDTLGSIAALVVPPVGCFMHSARSDLRRDGGVTVSLAIWLGWLVRSRRMGGQIAPPASAETVEILEMRSSAPGQFKAPAPQVGEAAV